MKKTLLFTLLFTTIIIRAQKNIYESNKFNSLTKNHEILAIIPFITKLDLKENITTEELKSLEEKEGYAVQNAFETYFSRGRKKKKYVVDFQNTKDTNALLSQNEITYQNIDIYTIKQLCEILEVDGIISGNLDLNILLSKGIPTGFSILDYFNGNSNYGRIGVKVSDGETGKLLWKYEKKINKKSGKNTTNLIELMMKQATKKFPYEKEKLKEKK